MMASAPLLHVPYLPGHAPQRRCRAWRTLVVLLAVWLPGALVAPDAAAQTTSGLFVDAPRERTLVGPSVGPVAEPVLGLIRDRQVRIDRELLDTVRPDVGRPGAESPMLTLNLFDDAVLEAAIDVVTPTSSGYALWGRLTGSQVGSVTLVVNGDTVAGSVQTPSGTYEIRPARGPAHVIRQIDPSALPPEGEPIAPPSEPRGADPRRSLAARDADSPGAGMTDRPGVVVPLDAGDAAEGPPEDGARIDVLVLYTTAAKEAVGGTKAIETIIDLMVAVTNQIYAGSDVIQRIHLVRAEEAEVDEINATGFPLVMRDPSDGYLDEVHELRERYAADLVHLIIDGSHAPYCGQASITFEEPPDEQASYAFGYTRHSCGAMVFAHELGHNMGLMHDRFVEDTADEYARAYPHAFGYVNQRGLEPDAPALSQWRTIMAYDRQCREADVQCWRMPRFSNPDLSHFGDPLGVPGDAPSSQATGPADARRLLNETRADVANFRVAPCLRGGDAVRLVLQASNGQYWTADGNGLGAVTADQDAPGAWEQFHLVDATGGCAQSGDSVALHTTDGHYVRAVGGGGGELDAAGTRAGNWESFVLGRPAGPGAVRSGDFVTLRASSGDYVSAEAGGGGALRADAADAGAWETFKVTEVFDVARNRPPLPAGPIPPQVLTAGGGARPVPLSAYFFEPDRDPLTYVATSSTDGVVGVRISGNAVWLTPRAAGEATVTVTAADPAGLKARQAIAVTVEASPVDVSPADGVAADRAALAALYRATDGPNWKEDTNWLRDDVPLGQWHGVSVDFAGRVTSLLLQENGLSGRLPVELARLDNLERLRLRSNALEGPIPVALARLAQLQSLDLAVNELTGPIPVELTRLTNLEGLHLDANNLTGAIPVELARLTNLQVLSLGGNELTGPIPVELARLSKLQGLHLHANKLTGSIPSELADLTNLERLSLGRNGLTGQVPAELADLTNLERLNLGGNALTGPIPVELANLTNLQTLDLWFNELTGPIPVELASLTNLQRLDLTFNKLTGPIPAELAKLTNLEYVRLTDNALEGELPAEFGDLTKLEFLGLDVNWRLTGPLPDSLTRLSKLRTLNIERTALCAPADPEFLAWVEELDEFRGVTCP